jgi:phosphoadenosine phosphosulfate reductase
MSRRDTLRVKVDQSAVIDAAAPTFVFDRAGTRQLNAPSFTVHIHPENLAFEEIQSLLIHDSIGIVFPKFTDGRGYSLAARLRELGYRGALHALGDIDQEVMFLLRRVGFDYFHLPNDVQRLDPHIVTPFSGHYQGASDQTAPGWVAAKHILDTIDQRLEVPLCHGRVALAFSAQAEDTLVLWRALQIGQPVTAFILDTGKLHSETLDYCEQLEALWSIRFERLRPQAPELQTLERELGQSGIYESLENRKRCCNVRKVEPLRQFLLGFDGWITGQRREQSITRSALDLVEHDAAFGIQKFNPLADLTAAQVGLALSVKDAPLLNPLHSRGYPSIGCEPCTRAVRPGEDPRAGRWWWEQTDSKECGLHPVVTNLRGGQ